MRLELRSFRGQSRNIAEDGLGRSGDKVDRMKRTGGLFDSVLDRDTLRLAFLGRPPERRTSPRWGRLPVIWARA
jgi:hypothetical protein